MVGEADEILKQARREMRGAIAELEESKRLVRVLEDMGESVIEEKNTIKQLEEKGKVFLKAIEEDRERQQKEQVS